MMNQFTLKLLAISLASLLVTPAFAADSNTAWLTKWVQGSWVNIRSAAAPDAPVLTHLIVNSEVQMEAADAKQKFCRIRWGQDQSGFIACALLTDAPLVIEIVGKRDNTNPNSAYSATRAFWMQASWTRLVDVGDYFWRTMLPKAQQDKEFAALNSNDGDHLPKLNRFPIPEFDAMKSVLAQGVIDAKELHPKRMIAWSNFQSILKSADANSKKVQEKLQAFDVRLWKDTHVKYLQQIQLEAAKPSLFLSASELGLPSSGPEELSSVFQIPYTLKVEGPPFWFNGGEVGGGVNRVGVWDIGAYELRMKEELWRYDLTQDGKVNSKKLKVSYRENWGGHCQEGFRWTSDEENPDPSGINKKPSAIAFYTRQALATQSAKWTKAKTIDLDYDKQRRVNPFDVFNKASISYVDLNEDGHPDFAVLEGWRRQYQSEQTTPQINHRIVFVNVAGSWHLFDIDEYAICSD